MITNRCGTLPSSAVNLPEPIWASSTSCAIGRGGDEPSTNVINDHVDPAAVARELGVLREYETLVEA